MQGALIMQKNKKTLLFATLALFGSTGFIYAPWWDTVRGVVASPDTFMKILQKVLITPVPKDFKIDDMVAEAGGPVMTLDEVSGNPAHKDMPVSFVALQLNSVLEGTLGKDLPVTVKELNELLAQAKKPGNKDLMLSDLTGNAEHAKIPVTNLVANTHYVVDQQRKEIDHMIRFYAKRVGLVAIVGIAGYFLYKSYTTMQARKKENIAKIEACFSLRNSQEKKSIDLNSTAKKVSGLARRWQDKKGGRWILTSAEKNEAEIISELAQETRIAIVQGQVLKAYAVDSSLQQRVIAAMQALVDANIPLVVLQGDEVFKDTETVKWLSAAFNNNKIAFLSNAADVLPYRAYGFTAVNLSLPEMPAA